MDEGNSVEKLSPGQLRPQILPGAGLYLSLDVSTR